MGEIGTLYPSRRDILNLLLEGDMTAVQLTDKMDIKLSTVRDHLEKLEKEGYVESYFERAERGRPKKKYTLTLESKKILPKKYQFLLEQLLKTLKEIQGEETIKKIMETISADITDVDEELLEEDIETRIQEVLKLRDKFDLYPSLSKDNCSYLIKHQNCGCMGLDNKYQHNICYLCNQVISRYLPDTEIEHTKSFARGDDVCIFRITPRSNK